jgi:hypothetical protein
MIMNTKLTKEEKVVAELSMLGISYLSRLSDIEIIDRPRKGWLLLADLIRQPSSRVRTASIALFLEHPEYAEEMPIAIKNLRSKNRTTLMLFYTAAVFLQQIYYQVLMSNQGYRFRWLPDMYGPELGISSKLGPEQSLIDLARRHQELNGTEINWIGTYKNVVRHQLNRNIYGTDKSNHNYRFS